MSDSPWQAWQFLLGEWQGEGGGDPGQGSGGFTFSEDLDGQILVRHNHASFTASEERPAITHRDLLIVSRQPDGSKRAVYFDNEGHTIHYAVDDSAEGGPVFISDAMPGLPRFRLAYAPVDADTVLITFEIAPPGAADFQLYIDSVARRK